MAKKRAPTDINGVEYGVGDKVVVACRKCGMMNGTVLTVTSHTTSGKDVSAKDSHGRSRGFYSYRVQKLFLPSHKDHEFVYGKTRREK